MRLIDADAFDAFSYKETEGYADCFDAGVLYVLEQIDNAPTIDAVTVDEIQKLRDELCESDEITFRGLSKINQFMVKHSTVKYDIYNTDW